MTEEPEASEPPRRPERAPDARRPSLAQWGFDTTIGATAKAFRIASSAAETTGRLARSVGASPVGQAAGSAVRSVTEPLTREGATVRDQLEENLPAAAREITTRVAPAAVEMLDANALIGAIDLNALLEHIDLDRLLERIDLNALLARVDMDVLMGQVDIDALIGRVDINKVMDDVDIEGLVSRTEIGGLIAKSTTGIAGEALDSVRRQGVRVDNTANRIVDRVLRREQRGKSAPLGPPLLVPVPALPAGENGEDTAGGDSEP